MLSVAKTVELDVSFLSVELFLVGKRNVDVGVTKARSTNNCR